MIDIRGVFCDIFLGIKYKLVVFRENRAILLVVFGMVNKK